jgi:hypothetical protein
MLWGSSYDGIKRAGNIHQNQTFTFHKLPGCMSVDCFAFIRETGKKIRSCVAFQETSANNRSDAQGSPQSKR